MFFGGHTRFATSSKANLDGTHPHQWTPPKRSRVYNFHKSNLILSQSSKFVSVDLSGRRIQRSFVPDTPINIPVENFITHNGDFEFYELNGKHYDIEMIQQWLAIATGSKIPTVVDSAAIAGMVDLIRCKGCFSLSCRYVICLGLQSSKMVTISEWLPSEAHYHSMGLLFEEALGEFQKTNPISLNSLGDTDVFRESLARKATEIINRRENEALLKAFRHHIRNGEDGASAYSFAKATVNAFFDNDLFQTVNIFMKKASGSFGLCVMSSLDAHSQLCIASRGQSMSIAFYPKKYLICYGSEQAAVKAGMLYDIPITLGNDLSTSKLNIEEDVQRLDLDDVGGEICLIDWSGSTNPISRPNRAIQPHNVMHGKVMLYLSQESNITSQPKHLYQRQTKLTKNPLILPLKEDCSDPILQDLRDIPKICDNIQEDWRNVKKDSMFSLNRLTAVNLGRRIKQRLEGYASGTIHRSHGKVDILLTGCEVSLWLAEQFASDLQKAFPNLRTQATSSNKLLGLFGQQDISVPTIGFPFTESTLRLDDAIVIIVSHSGGTFGPLSCSSLLQSMTKNIFVVTSEWDTQIGKQLRSMSKYGKGHELLLDSHIFTTGVGIRVAEPCTVSVVATHQLLTNIFQYISIVILSNNKHRQLSGATITEKDLQILERCNRSNIFALEEIVGAHDDGTLHKSEKEAEIRKAGDVWSEHILENAKAYIISFVYIFATVISGFPLISGIAHSVGLPARFTHLTRLFDAMIYFFLPQINVLLLRVLQKRPLRHRMVGRTVVIGDCPWVAQAAEAFLSKIFACSYSIAGLNVHSANPSDHLVHRMTHRVVRGTLLICGRPDGRLSALTASENAVSLSINQASSIQSIGSGCEAITIGHNKFKLPLSTRAIFLNRNRPLFLCEYLLAARDNDEDNDEIKSRESTPIVPTCYGNSHEESANHLSDTLSVPQKGDDTLLESIGKNLPNRRRKMERRNSSSALLGHYKSIEQEVIVNVQHDHHVTDKSEKHLFNKVLNATIQEKKWLTQAGRLFEYLNLDQDGKLKKHEFVNGLSDIGCGTSEDELSSLFIRL